MFEDAKPDVDNEIDDAKVTLAVAVIENKKHRFMLVLRKFGWNPEEKKFRDGASEKCMELLKMLQTALMCECLLMNLVKLTAEKREPMPLVSMENLSALVCIEFSLAIADAMQTEADVVHHKKCAEVEAKVLLRPSKSNKQQQIAGS